ncbi:hypothetical protein GALMADRAFT_81499 [Galerina marginata CBS 339.88]|uniref:Uncharacterized protein n=1 Tax=Galerina marginata (strain CBS 339.88) TaxID=685588 RepID=A0A067S4J8_GALM3|nr:hypothetical protein GALMADRAFT_81499 [Galerina marginata CBS 339.88]
MTRSLGRKPKRRSEARISSLQKARDLRWTANHADSGTADASMSKETVNSLKKELSNCKEQLKHENARYWNERRRNNRLQKANNARKVNLKHVKEQASRLRGALQMLGKELEQIQEVADQSLRLLQAKVNELEEAKKDLTWERSILVKRNKRIVAEIKGLKDRMRSKRRGGSFRQTQRGIYTQQSRALARLMLAHLNIEITYSSDSTSHKHIEFESRTIALQVVDYTKPTDEPKWTLRTLGVGTSINHTSETQVDGLKQRLREIAEIFNNSPFAKRNHLKFKKSHEMIRIWKMEAILQRLGEEALFRMNVSRVIALLMPLKANQIEKHGGQEAWDKLSDEERAAADIEIVREIGKQVFETLPEDHRRRLTCFIRTGCCMHKDLNCNKGGDKAMQEMWGKEDETPPILLANKDNAAVLAHQTDDSTPTNAEIRAAEVSKRGGSHATMLGGLICRNKDKKKGQQDTYDFYMEYHVGHRVPYPDVSNTRYGSHGEAAGTIIAYRQFFINFMEFVRNGKDKPGETNVEKNFANALKDVPTITELCVLALYNVNVSRSFMKHVRANDNILDLKPFFERKVNFLDKVISDPTLWTSPNVSYETSSLDGRKRDDWCTKVMTAIWEIAPELPNLKKAIIAFVKGARETFVGRFSEEFKDGGDIDKLTQAERDTLFFSSTNDINEGNLGSWRLGQRRRPAETLHKFNAAFVAGQNNTEQFISNKLTENADHLYMRQEARKRDESGLQKQMKAAQIQADNEKVTENVVKETRRQEKRDERAAILVETGKKLYLTNADIDELDNAELNRQLDFHREEERKLQVPKPVMDEPETVERVPLKSHMKKKPERVLQLKKAVQRYLQRNPPTAAVTVPSQPLPAVNNDVSMAGPEDSFYESDYNDDLA